MRVALRRGAEWSALLLAVLACGDADQAPGVQASAGAPGSDDGMPALLSQTGLYANRSAGALAAFVEPYAPRFELWADGALKRRWLYLPAGTRIATEDMDHWTFPVGTKVWKEFSLDGRRLETRLLWKRDRRWARLAYTWNERQDEAILTPNRGEEDVLGTGHDVPGRTACDECHEGMPDQLLGVSAIQLSHDGPGLTFRKLAASGRLSAAPADGDVRIPAGPAWEALGYLHANCGNCHAPTSVTWDRLDLDLWLRSAERHDPAATVVHRSSVGVPLTDTASPLSDRVDPANPAGSGLVFRMMLRGDDKAMPPLASEVTDDAGLARLRAWIEAL